MNYKGNCSGPNSRVGTSRMLLHSGVGTSKFHCIQFMIEDWCSIDVQIITQFVSHACIVTIDTLTLSRSGKECGDIAGQSDGGQWLIRQDGPTVEDQGWLLSTCAPR